MVSLLQSSDNGNFIPPFLSGEHRTSTTGTNGLLAFDAVLLPEEVLMQILSHVDTQYLLKCSLVCRRWNTLVKSYSVWSTIYTRKYGRKCKKLPWYLYYTLLTTKYFDNNILSEFKTQHWKSQVSLPITGYGNLNSKSSTDVQVLILTEHFQSKALLSMFSRTLSNEMWLIRFDANKLFHYIIDKYKPHIYIKNCHSEYEVNYGIYNEKIHSLTKCGRDLHRVKKEPTRNQHTAYNEVELSIDRYPIGLRGIVLAGKRYSNTVKRPGENIMFLFNSIEAVDDENASTATTSEISCHWNLLPAVGMSRLNV